jgi:hypothetical protein
VPSRNKKYVFFLKHMHEPMCTQCCTWPTQGLARPPGSPGCLKR